MSPEIIKCDWNQFESYCEILAKKISLNEGDAIAVLQAKREGGLHLGRMMEFLKGVEVYELNYSVNETESGLAIEVIGPFPPGLANRHVFLLTEIVNSGLIFGQAVEDLEGRGNRITGASIYYREGSIVPPHICYIHLIKVDCGVRFTEWE